MPQARQLDVQLTNEEGSRVTAGRNSIPLNTANTTALMLTPTTSVSTTGHRPVHRDTGNGRGD